MPYRRKPSTRMTRKSTLPRRKPFVKKTRPGLKFRRQARFNVSSSQYNLNKRISQQMSRMSETKLIACNPINRLAANGQAQSLITTGSPAIATVCAWRGILASVPNNWDAGLNDLAGIFTTRGDADNQHVGSYIYLKKTHISMQIDMTFGDNAKPPVQFRVVVAKARQSVTPAGTTEYPQNTLFISPQGPASGWESLGLQAMDSFTIMNQPLNRRDWTILRDQRFTLAHPFRQNFTVVNGSKSDYVVPTSIGYSGKYPCRKNLVFNLPHYAKTRVNSDGHPLNYDSRYMIYIFATSIGSAAHAPDGWTVAARGTTSFTDN